MVNNVILESVEKWHNILLHKKRESPMLNEDYLTNLNGKKRQLIRGKIRYRNPESAPPSLFEIRKDIFSDEAKHLYQNEEVCCFLNVADDLESSFKDFQKGINEEIIKRGVEVARRIINRMELSDTYRRELLELWNLPEQGIDKYPWARPLLELEYIIHNTDPKTLDLIPFLFIGKSKGYLKDIYRIYIHDVYFLREQDFYDLLGEVKHGEIQPLIPPKNRTEIPFKHQTILREINR